ncbi:hypothetical protein FWF89_02395 [Candidatus Saccharibacteria bacterium]|nr:hypothetical protein [Candidatus Saccharibacteria bacterium]
MSEKFPKSVSYDESVLDTPYEFLESKELSRGVLAKLGRRVLDLAAVKVLLPKQYAESHTNRAREHKFVQEQEDFRQQEVWRQEEEQKQLADEARRKEAEISWEAHLAQAIEAREAQERASAEFANQMREKQRELRDKAEAQLNETFVGVDELETASMNNDQMVGKRNIETANGNALTVYDLNGFEFRFLVHNIGYKDVAGGNVKGASLSRYLKENPDFWMRHQEAIKSREYGYGELEEQGGTAVSMSYFDTARNLSTATANAEVEGKTVRYGFTRIRPGGLVDASRGDAVTSHNVEDRKSTYLPDVENVPEYLAGNAGRSAADYNEVLIRRYDDEGNPQPPDFIETYDGFISDEAKKHAEYFKIPIVNINLRYYDTKRSII